jgi:predicted transcriptional regulator
VTPQNTEDTLWCNRDFSYLRSQESTSLASARPKRQATTTTPAVPAESEPSWTFLTNHAHVLLCIAREPEVRMRDVAESVGITERAVQRIVADLEEAGYIVRSRLGRRNRYEIQFDRHLRHPIERHQRVASLIALVLGDGAGKPER